MAKTAKKAAVVPIERDGRKAARSKKSIVSNRRPIGIADRVAPAKKAASRLGTGRGIESMFRNSYRAQLAMLGLATTKANIMISVNGFLLSMLTVMGAYVLTNEPWLLIPLGIFLVTCVVSILFAVLAARPQKVDHSKTELENFRKDEADLLVFEHFAHLSKEDYMTAMVEMMQDQDRVYQAMVAQLHFLGVSANRRFDLLHVSYKTFVGGLVASFLAFATVAGVFYL